MVTDNNEQYLMVMDDFKMEKKVEATLPRVQIPFNVL